MSTAPAPATTAATAAGASNLEINRERGEVSFIAQRRTAIKEQPGSFEFVPRRYTLKLSMSAAVALEARLKRPIGQILERAGQLDFTSIQDLTHALAQYHHRDEIKTLQDAGDLLDDCGGALVFFKALEALDQINKAPASIASQAAEVGQGNPPDAAALEAVGVSGASTTSPLDAAG